EFDMRGLSAAVLEGNAAGLHRLEAIDAVFSTGRAAAPAGEIGIVARGINIGLHTRMYFPEETEANAADPLLSSIEHRERVATMIATRDGATCH
ncbi:hypothetical protein ACC685_36405, partial [Rhizobium ruizarguesonis]